MYKTMGEMQIEKSGKRERRNEVVKRGLYVIAVDSFAEGNAIVNTQWKKRYVTFDRNCHLLRRSQIVQCGNIRWHVTNFIPWWFDSFPKQNNGHFLDGRLIVMIIPAFRPTPSLHYTRTTHNHGNQLASGTASSVMFRKERREKKLSRNRN